MTRASAKGRYLAEYPFVSLVEALTWIAFADAMSHDQLLEQIAVHCSTEPLDAEDRFRSLFGSHDANPADGPGTGYFENRERGLQRLAEAWQHLREEAERGSLTVRGRYARHFTRAEAAVADTTDLSRNVLATFSQFDVSTAGIRRQPDGSPDMLWPDHPDGFDREFDALGTDPCMADGYLLVEAERAGVIRCWPNPRGAPRMREEDVMLWCENWRKSGKGNGMDKAWRDFHADPSHAGLSRDDVFRPAWRKTKGI